MVFKWGFTVSTVKACLWQFNSARTIMTMNDYDYPSALSIFTSTNWPTNLTLYYFCHLTLCFQGTLFPLNLLHVHTKKIPISHSESVPHSRFQTNKSFGQSMTCLTDCLKNLNANKQLGDRKCVCATPLPLPPSSICIMMLSDKPQLSSRW